MWSIWRRGERPRYHRNAPGPFYVENECCITCRAPERQAPDLIAHDETDDYEHCFFKKQPSTPEELDRALRAMNYSCVEALRYAGTDPEIIRRLRRQGQEHCCDRLPLSGRLRISKKRMARKVQDHFRTWRGKR